MGSDAGDAGAGDWEGAEGEGGALGGEEWAEAEDWVSAGVIKGEMVIEARESALGVAWRGVAWHGVAWRGVA